MDVAQEPLSELEEAELRQLLEESASASLPCVRGVFSALACEPSLTDPTEWLPLILGTQVKDKHTLSRIFALLMRDRYAIAQCSALGRPYAPHPADFAGVEQFCKGFMRVTQASSAWKNDTTAIELALPIAALAGYLPFTSLAALQPEVQVDEAAWLAAQREQLPALLARCWSHFAKARQRQPTEAREKVGRNDPCPCGSGKKYKRCCAELD